jgi:hypothetical protein
VYGLYNGVVTLYDRETESVWFQVGGRAVKGPLLGTRLKTGPLLDTTWGRWKALHPDTLVMSPDTPDSQFYPPKGARMSRGSSRFPAPFFRQTLTRGDTRLPPFEMVLAVTLPAVPAEGSKPEAKEKPVNLYRVYPTKTLRASPGVLEDMLGTTPVVICYEADTESATALSRQVDGKTLTFEVRRTDGKPAFYDKETGTRWSLEGKGEEGPLAGKSLPRLDSHLSEWYGWVSYFPETSIYGRDDPPQPLDLSSPATPLPDNAKEPPKKEVEDKKRP